MTSQPVLRPLGPLQSSCRPRPGRFGTVLGGEATILHRPRPLQGRLLPRGQRLVPVLGGLPAIGRRQPTLGAGDLPIDHPLLPAGQQRRIVGTQTAAGDLVTNHGSLIANLRGLVAGIGSLVAAGRPPVPADSQLVVQLGSFVAQLGRLVAFPGSLLAVVTDPLTRGHYLSSSPLPTGVSSHALGGSSRGGQPATTQSMPGQPELGKAGPSLRPTSAIRPIARSPPAFPASCRDPSTGGSRALARHAAGLEREPDHGQRPAPAVTDPAVRSCEQLAERCVSPIGKETRTAWRGGTSARRRGSTVIAAAVVLAALAVTGWAPAGAAAPQSPAGSCVPGKLVDFCRAAPPADGFRLDKGAYETIAFPGASLTVPYRSNDRGQVVGTLASLDRPRVRMALILAGRGSGPGRCERPPASTSNGRTSSSTAGHTPRAVRANTPEAA